MKNRLVWLLLSTGLLLAAAGAWLLWQGLHPAQSGATRPLPAFRLQTAGGPFTETDLRGHWTLIFFGYTQCPDVCPASFSAIKEITRTLAVQGTPRPAVVFVSVDPARDSLPLLAAYAHAFDPAFIGATASDAELDPLVTALGAFYQRNAAGEKMHYSVDHTADLYLLDPAGRLSQSFAPPLDAAAIAREVRTKLAYVRPGG